jgi:hypothetical protein
MNHEHRDQLRRLAVMQGQLSGVQRHLFELMPELGHREAHDVITKETCPVGELMFMGSMQMLELQVALNDLSNQIREENGEKRVELGELPQALLKQHKRMVEEAEAKLAAIRKRFQEKRPLSEA